MCECNMHKATIEQRNLMEIILGATEMRKKILICKQKITFFMGGSA